MTKDVGVSIDKSIPKVDSGNNKVNDTFVKLADPGDNVSMTAPPRIKKDDKLKDTSIPTINGTNECLQNGTSKDKLIVTLDEAKRKIEEVGDFSIVLQDVLLFLLNKSQNLEDNLGKETETRKTEAEKNNKEIRQVLQDENTKLKQIIKKENEERQRDMKEIEGFVKKENHWKIKQQEKREN